MRRGEVAAALVELVRAPAALTVLGDTVVGGAAAGEPTPRGRRWALPLASASLYWAGMALNDWADRDLDAVERPERPIPSGRVSAGAALATGGVLTAAGLGLAGFGGGQPALRAAVPLAAAIWAYDTRLKGTAAGPCGMSACRALDVLLGAGGRWRDAAPAAFALGVHTFGVTWLSRGEVYGGDPAAARGALATTAMAAGTGVAGRARGPLRLGDRLASVALGAGYAVTVGRVQLAAAGKPTAERVRTATAAGIHGMVPLQASLAARHGAARAGLVLAGVLPIARRLARKVSPT